MTQLSVALNNCFANTTMKVIICTLTLCIDFNETCSCPAHNFVLHGLISILFRMDNNHDKTMCRVAELGH